MLILGGVMLSVNGALSWLHFHDLTTRFEVQRTATRERLVEQAFALRTDFGLRLQALAGMLAALDSVGVGLFQTPAGNALLRQHFDSYWSVLQLDLGLDSLQVYGPSGPPVASWRTNALVEVKQDAQVRDVIVQERAMHWTRCEQLCTQFAAAPILVAGRVAGAVLLGTSLADVVVSFHRLSGADLGVLVPVAMPAGNNALSALGMQVIGLSNAERNLPLLQQLTALPLLRGESAWRKLLYGGREFELSFLALDARDDAQSSALLVVVDDLTQARADIDKSVLDRLLGELAASFFSLLLLALLVHAPLQRMTRAVRAIPLLGLSAFPEVRERIAPRARRLVDDEIDSLDKAAIDLSHRLENLEKDVAAHLQDISIERDFSKLLLDTAHVIILTQSTDGEILTLNPHGQKMSGWREEDLPGKRFSELVRPDGSSELAIAQAVQEIAAGERQHVQLESILASSNGQSYEITWNHSRLVGASGVVMILSVGIDHTKRKIAESQRKLAESRVKDLRERDPLTGLVNRQHFQDQLEQALASARHSARDGALLYLDLDGFKYVNDLNGHQAGDELLRKVADEVGHVVARGGDLLGRLGGDELGILLHVCDHDGAIQVAEKINKRLAEIKFPGLGASHRVSASIGIVVFSEATMDVKQLLANADIAMYQAKSKGGAGWHLYSDGEGVQEKMQSRLHWEEMINRSLGDRGFIVHYQPILDIRARQVSHYEALVRMRAEDGSPIPPGMFMEVAENSGLIREIDRYVIHDVFGKMLSLFAVGKYYKFSINLSGISINDPRLLSFISDELSRSALLPSHVVFEITETAAVSDFSKARAFMNAVRELGCAFSLDDFGVGFSSFNYVKQLPVDYVKIDGSFVRTLVDSPDDQVFVRALAEVARGFGKKTVAEFVEDERALNMLRTFGVDYAQGYFIGKPGPEIT
ncbi:MULTISPECIES: bifunctional diguanylate cyclase/phosphodiesterase [Candidatus Accumulibacter]|uniref:bifunctional diguanylate cyclase/phosphodiesterase n=1 Tax=Candidatus Accumulibacter TaxID=327159 RepID=UPI00145EAF9B|nr:MULTISPECIES: EAL domain-containing protein [Candidatus Accumulibacter]